MMRILFRVVALFFIIIVGAVAYNVLREFPSGFSVLGGSICALFIYFVWLQLRLSMITGIPIPYEGIDPQSIATHPVARRAIIVLLISFALFVTVVILLVTGCIE